MPDRVVYLVADSATAYRVARDRRIDGDPRDLPVSNLRSALPRGTGVQLTVDENDVRTDSAGALVVASTALTPDRIGRAFQPWHVDVEPEQAARWKGYLDPVYDLTLTNLVGATTPNDLDRKETPLVEHRALELIASPVPATFDLEHLQRIHGHLFQDVYPWAGETRSTIDMHRPGGPSFVPWQEIPSSIDAVAAWVRDQGFLRGLAPEAFADRAAVVYHGLNTTHAFREGNGRTQRVWISDLADAAGYSLDWRAIHGLRNDLASHIARDTGDLAPLRELFTEAGAYAGLLAWSSREHWLTFVVPVALAMHPEAAKRHSIDPATLAAFCRAKSGYADPRNARRCIVRPDVLASVLGLSTRRVQSYNAFLRAAGLEVVISPGWMLTFAEKIHLWHEARRNGRACSRHSPPRHGPHAARSTGRAPRDNEQ